jgi:hypothetical protein
MDRGKDYFFRRRTRPSPNRPAPTSASEAGSGTGDAVRLLKAKIRSL